MFNLLMLIVFIFDGLIIGSLTFYLVKALFGENPLSRFLRVILAIAAGGYYFFKVLSYSTDGKSMTTFAILSFAPIALIIIVRFIGYVFNQKV